MADDSRWKPTEKSEGQHSSSPSPARRNPRESARPKVHVLIAEDNAADVSLVRIALSHHRLDAELIVHPDGEKMLRYIARIDAGEVPCPDVVLLDLNLPRVNGHAILARMRQSPLCSEVPVIVVSSSNASEDRDSAAQLGATDYFVKPIDYDQFMFLGEIVARVVNRTRETN